VSDRIHLITHIGKNLLIVLHTPSKAWLFRAVNSAGKTIQEQTDFESAEAAERAGREWFERES
jgi:hypothetical protein